MRPDSPLLVRNVNETLRRRARLRSVIRAFLASVGLVFLLGSASLLRGETEAPIVDATIGPRKTAPAEPGLSANLLAVPRAPLAFTAEESVCPSGFEPLGTFEITGYGLVEETAHSAAETVTDPCGLVGTFATAFLFGEGVRLQGSGRALDGRFVRYDGGGCFAEQECPLTASGSCAQGGRTAAVDTSVLPMGSRVWIEGIGERIAEDRGGAVEGRAIDVYFAGEDGLARARRLGRTDRAVCLADGDAG